MMRRKAFLVMTAVLMFLMLGCGNRIAGNEQKDTVVKNETTENTEASEQDAVEAESMNDSDEKPLKIAIVAGTSGVNDGSFNQDIYEGVLAYVEKCPGSSVTPILGDVEQTEKATRLVAEIAEKDYDVIVCCGYYFEGIGATAQKHQEIKFILVDAFLKDEEGNEVEMDNVYAMQFAEQESGFFAGMAAALETKTGKVAVITGIAVPSNVNYQYGFECGVKYVNETEGKNVMVVEMPAFAGTDVTGAYVGGNYIESFADETTGRVLANTLIARNCDILFAAAGGSGKGVFDAVKYADDVKVIGCDIDQYDDGVFGKENIVLTSALKVMHSNVEKQLLAIDENTFKGDNVVLHADTDSIDYVSDLNRCQLSKETIEKIDAAYELVKSGEIVPAANFNGITPDDFTTKN